MSWQTYVDDHLMCDIDGQGQHLTVAAIVGYNGSVSAQSFSFPEFKTSEITGIMNDFAEPGHLVPTGLYLGGTKYMVIQGEPGVVIRWKGLGSFFFRYLPGLLHSILVEMGSSEDIYNHLATFLLIFGCYGWSLVGLLGCPQSRLNRTF